MTSELQVAIDSATLAGARVKEIYDSQDFTTVEKADGKGPLTEADLASNDILIRNIRKAFPNDAILSEETADTAERLDNPRCWIIDPIDGTREFTQGIPEFVVSVGFVLNGKARAGALFNPATGELFAGGPGLGFQYQGKPTNVTEHDAIKGARLLVSRTEYNKGWFDPYKDQATLRPCGSVAYKFGLVAAGQAEASFTPKPRNEWDLCGGVACILGAGGRTTDGTGTDYRFNRPTPLHIGVCGTNAAIHDSILTLMKSVNA